MQESKWRENCPALIAMVARPMMSCIGRRRIRLSFIEDSASDTRARPFGKVVDWAFISFIKGLVGESFFKIGPSTITLHVVMPRGLFQIAVKE
jgi:hypothetical protein